MAAAQKYTRESAKAADEKASNLHAAVASVDVDTGEVLALYGGPDYVKNSRNWATTPRPTASTFKTYALAAGLEDGYSLYSRFNGNTFTPPGDSTPVRNEFSNQYGSAVPLLRATAQSINTAFVDLVTSMDNGAKKTMDMAEAVGAPKGAGWDDNSRLPLGTAEVSPLAQASAYATFANDGVRVPEHVVREVRSRDGKVLYKAAPEEKRAVSEEIAADVNFALSSVVDGGTGRAAQSLDRPVAGKTGTKDREDDIVSAWFVGYTKQISTAVMYVAGKGGNDDLDPYARPGDSTFFGGTYPALTWADYMAVATEGQPVEDFGGPAYVNRDKYSEPTLRPEPTDRDPSESRPRPRTPSPRPTTPEPGADGDRARSRAPSRRPVHRRPGLAATVEHPPDRPEPQAVEDQRRRPRVLARGDGGAPDVPVRSTDPPSLTDGFVATVSQRFGGPLGRHAGDGGGRWWNPVRVALLTGTLMYLAGMVFRLPCRRGRRPLPLPVLLRHPAALPRARADAGQHPLPGLRGLPGAGVPGADRLVPRAGADPHPAARRRPGHGPDGASSRPSRRCASWTSTSVLLGGLFLVAVWAQVRTVAPRPWDGMMLAASPCVAAAALINWDMLPVALTALGMLAWSRRRPGLAGIFLGLGMAAKLYPLFLLGPLLLLCLRVAADGRLLHAAVDVRGQLGAGQPARPVAGAGGVAQLLELQRRPRRRLRLHLVRLLPRREPGAQPQPGQRGAVRPRLPGRSRR